MSATTEQRIGLMDGDAALPRRNGELVFEAPWEGRAFGMAVALNDAAVYDWEEFRQQLIAEIAAGDPARSYYQRWLAALETVVLRHGLVTPQELTARIADYASGAHDADGHTH